jgi:hypothetical protein
VGYYWYAGETGGNPYGSISKTRVCPAPSEWWVEARYRGNALKPRLKVTIDEYPALTAGSIGSDQTICYGKIPLPLTETDSPGGGDASYTYQWQQSPNGVDWTDITGATGTAYSPPPLKSDTFYRRNVTSCTTESGNEVKIKVYPALLYNYPDLRIRVCPDAGTLINLSKYIDTLALTYLKWESVSPYIPISNTETGLISTDNLNVHTRVYTLSYTVNNPCMSDAVTRKVYLEALKPDKMRPLRDTVVICCEHAEAVQINQIFGIDASGTWEYHSSTPGDVNTYVTKSTSATYDGAVIMNGKGICESAIPSYSYHGINAKKVEFTYTADDDSCLHGREYKTVIILTPDITK